MRERSSGLKVTYLLLLLVWPMSCLSSAYLLGDLELREKLLKHRWHHITLKQLWSLQDDRILCPSCWRLRCGFNSNVDMDDYGVNMLNGERTSGVGAWRLPGKVGKSPILIDTINPVCNVRTGRWWANGIWAIAAFSPLPGTYSILSNHNAEIYKKKKCQHIYLYIWNVMGSFELPTLTANMSHIPHLFTYPSTHTNISTQGCPKNLKGTIIYTYIYIYI